MEQWMWCIWLGILILAIIVEAVTEELVAVWFIGGSLVSLILSLIAMNTDVIPWWTELIVFVAVSILLLLSVRPLAKKYLTRDKVDLNADTMVGKLGKMTKTATELDYGLVKISGVTWTAVVPSGTSEIPSGEKVKVLAIEGNKLIVKPVEKEER